MNPFRSEVPVKLKLIPLAVCAVLLLPAGTPAEARRDRSRRRRRSPCYRLLGRGRTLVRPARFAARSALFEDVRILMVAARGGRTRPGLAGSAVACLGLTPCGGFVETRTSLIRRRLERDGWYLARRGSGHDVTGIRTS